MVKPYNRKLKPLSRMLRSNMTDAEQVLWSRLRRKQVRGLQFYRQKPLGSFIADFYCPAAKLVVEVDGSQHLEASGERYDARRTETLEAMGLRVLRFDNRQVLSEIDGVMEAIWQQTTLVQGSKNPP